MYKLKKGLLFTDIHFGRKQNSDEHNQICSKFIDFAIEGVKTNKCDHIIFLGDWFETRNAINVSTINYAYNCANKLNDLNIPVYFIVGNHDMYTKHNRLNYSTVDYNAFNNFHVISEPTMVDDIGTGVLICPYLFHDEYSSILKYDTENVYGHFEFTGFVVTGTNVTYTNGPDHNELKKFKNIFSGHFHKRQILDNVKFIGNTFCMDFSDANDSNRGYCIHDHMSDSISFVNWEDSPRYITTTVSEILDEKVIIPPGANVRCTADVNMEYSELMNLKNALSEQYSLTSIVVNEPTMQYNIEDEEIMEEQQFTSIDEAIVTMLTNIDSPSIDNKQLIKIYNQLT